MQSQVRPATDPQVVGLVLAAGRGMRFGGAKLVAPLEGRPLLAHLLDAVGAAVGEGTLSGAVVVVPAGPGASPEAGELRHLAEERGFAVVGNHDPPAGLARSLRLGLAALERPWGGKGQVAAAMVLLGDQPRTRLDVIRALVAEWRTRRAPILVPRYGDGAAPGNPVVLSRAVWPLARRVRGDRGMSTVVDRHAELVAYLDFEGANPDVDVPADLAALEAAIERSLP